MFYLIIASKIIIFISIINVWFFRYNKNTPYRPGKASSMKDEFAAYGLSETMMFIVGGLKILSALGLILSIWFTQLAFPAAAVMALLMLGAIGMHLKVKDELKKSMPAFIFLVLSAFIALTAKGIL